MRLASLTNTTRSLEETQVMGEAQSETDVQFSCFKQMIDANLTAESTESCLGQCRKDK